MTNAQHTLRKATRCHFCGETMNAGEPFAWYEKSAFRASKYHTVPSRQVVRHVNNCVFERREREAAERKAALERFTAEVDALVVAGKTDEALALVTGKAGQ